MLTVAVGWQVYSLTGSALDLGLVGLVQFLPAFALVLVVGHIADRFDRRHVLRVCQLVALVAVATLATGSVMGWITGACDLRPGIRRRLRPRVRDADDAGTAAGAGPAAIAAARGGLQRVGVADGDHFRSGRRWLAVCRRPRMDLRRVRRGVPRRRRRC